MCSRIELTLHERIEGLDRVALAPWRVSAPVQDEHPEVAQRSLERLAHSFGWVRIVGAMNGYHRALDERCDLQ
jgi:hypothetical protein